MKRFHKRCFPYARGNLYSSDDSLQLFSLSMRRNVRYSGAAVDFINVEGIDGIYIANQISGNSFADPAFVAQRKTIDAGPRPSFIYISITIIELRGVHMVNYC